MLHSFFFLNFGSKYKGNNYFLAKIFQRENPTIYFVYLHTYVIHNTYIHISTHTYTHHTHTYIHTYYILTYIHTYTHTHIHTYIHTYVHTDIHSMDP